MYYHSGASIHQWPVRVTILLIVLTMFGYAAPIPGADQTDPLAAAQPVSWYDGPIEYSSIGNSLGSALEQGIGAYVGVCAAPEAGLPSLNHTYYIHVVVAGRGDAVGVRSAIDVALPANTVPAIDASHRIHYFSDFDHLPDAESPQTLPPSSLNPGAYRILSADTANGNTWSVPLGRIIEIQIPVVSTSALTNGTLQANVRCTDGSTSSWLNPRQSVLVFGVRSDPVATAYQPHGAVRPQAYQPSRAFDIAGRSLSRQPGRAVRFSALTLPDARQALRYETGDR